MRCQSAAAGAVWALAIIFLAGPPAVADETFVSNGVKINYNVRGTGEPVILIHGWLSSGWLNWDLPGTSRLLAKSHQAIWLDMPGHGRSDKPTTEKAYGPELIAHVERLMDHLKLKRAHVVGYSMGGIIAANFASKHPKRTASLTLGGMGWLREGSFEQKTFAAGGKDGQPVGLCFRSLATLALKEEEILAIRVPAQVLIGDDDFLKKAYVDPLARVRKDWPVVEIKNANHLSCVIQSQFQQEIQKWLVKHREK